MEINANTNNMLWTVKSWVLWSSQLVWRIHPTLNISIWWNLNNLFAKHNVIYYVNPSSSTKLIWKNKTQIFSLKIWKADHKRYVYVDLWYLNNWEFVVDNNVTYWYINTTSWTMTDNSWDINCSMQFLAPSNIPPTWNIMYIRILVAWHTSFTDVRYLKIYIY